MKRTAIGILLAAALAGGARAQLPQTGSICLYADEARAYFATCPFPQGYPVAKIEMWIWCLPSAKGLAGADFAVSFPSNVIRDRITLQPLLSQASGDLATGFTARFGACQWDWVWIAHQALYVSTHAATAAEIIPHAGLGVYRFLNCDGQLCCFEPCLKGTNLFINTSAYPCLPPELAIASESPTWGIIKGFFGE